MDRYIIENGKAYLVVGKEAYRVSFDKNGKMIANEKEIINVKGKNKYTYDELIRKFNVNLIIKKENAKKKLLDNLDKVSKEKIDNLQEEVSTLNNIILEKDKKIEELESLLQSLETVSGENSEETDKNNNTVNSENSKLNEENKDKENPEETDKNNK